MLERITVTHPNGRYDVLVGAGLLSRLAELAPTTSSIITITDTVVGPLYANLLEAPVITIPAGEQHKTLATANAIYEQLLALGIDRKSTVLALGGGVVGDVTGFVAATYMRGINFIQCPTTLLAMVDASVGGKTGVDMPQGKNLVGAFKQPTAVIADLTTLQSLPPAEFASGMAEVVKHGLLTGEALWQQLWQIKEAGKPFASADLQALVVAAIQVKVDVVTTDPFEQGQRAILNLGHTFGHAFEQVSGYELRHGEAVAIGLVAATNLAARLGFCQAELQSEVELLLQAVPLPTRIPHHLQLEQIYQMMGSDKKKDAGELRFVLLHGVGRPFVTNQVPTEAVMATLAAVQASAES